MELTLLAGNDHVNYEVNVFTVSVAKPDSDYDVIQKEPTDDLKIPTESVYEFDLKLFYYFSDLDVFTEGSYTDENDKALELDAPKIY